MNQPLKRGNILEHKKVIFHRIDVKYQEQNAPISFYRRNGVKNLIEVSHLVKRYGDHAAVDDLSFTVEKGQIYGFLGPNGAGKSTTMNILTGYLAPTSGEVKIGGHNILEEPEEARKCIGYLPEIPPVYPEMTVLEYLNFAAGLKKLPAKARGKYVAEAMEMTGTVEVQNRLIRNLSKGFRQRVGLAQAILGFPEIIILDEPMVGLDPKQITEIRELIRELGKKPAITVKPKTTAEEVFPYLEMVDMVLVMTVEPGFGGQSFMADMLPKIAALRAEIDRRGLNVEIQVDGGINADTAKLVAEAGADIAVIGSALFNSPDPKALVDGVHAL